MKFFRKKFGFSLIMIFFSLIFVQQIFSQEEGFGVFDITFHTGVNSPAINHLQEMVDISTLNFTGFRIYIRNNHANKKINLKLDFGIQTRTNDTENILGCDLSDIHQGSFKQYMKFETGSFEIEPGSGVYKYITLDFNACNEGPTLGCIAVQDANSTGIGIFDIGLSKIGFIDFDVIGDALNCNTITVSAFQEKRNLFPTEQKILPNQKTKGTLGFYSTSGQFITTGSIDIGRGGTGKTNINRSLSGYYNVTFQGLSSTKALVSGIFINPDNREINFTTGENIFGATIEDRDENSISDDGLLYLTIGEIPPYDGEINGDDIAKILPYINKTNKEYGLDKHDIDADGGITIADIGIIIYNLHKRSVGNQFSDTGLLPRMLP